MLESLSFDTLYSNAGYPTLNIGGSVITKSNYGYLANDTKDKFRSFLIERLLEEAEDVLEQRERLERRAKLESIVVSRLWEGGYRGAAYKLWGL